MNKIKPKLKNGDTSKALLQEAADHELFLQAFEKPTQIYKYLKARSKFSPLFRVKNLTYMPKRTEYPQKSRKNFDIKSMLKQLEETDNIASPVPTERFLNVKFTGVHGNLMDPVSSSSEVRVESLLVIIGHRKRKEPSLPVMTISFGEVSVPCNPPEDEILSGTTVSIPTETMFKLNSLDLEKSYYLLLRVTTTSSVTEDACSRKKRNGVKTEQLKCVQYGADVVIYDRNTQCLLATGEYQLLLQKVPAGAPQSANNKSARRNAGWEPLVTKRQEEISTPTFRKLTNGPTLNFKLEWTDSVDAVADVKSEEHFYKTACEEFSSNGRKSRAFEEGRRAAPRSKLKVVYQFLYNSNSRQQTEASESLHCPWCAVNCRALYSLLKHLKLCHSRFNFSYVPIPQGARIDVSINENFDGSFSTTKKDGRVGYGFRREGPVRRTTVSNILVCHPKRPECPSLSEFLRSVDDRRDEAHRSYVSGHTRIYHHTGSCLPVYPKELDVDSESEGDPPWLRKKSALMIDEFTDVNEGEKSLIKLWNLHVMKYGFVGDCQLAKANAMFVEAHGKEILEKNLYRNFVLHLTNQQDFGLISPVTVYTVVQSLQAMLKDNPAAVDSMVNTYQEKCKRVKNYKGKLTELEGKPAI